MEKGVTKIIYIAIIFFIGLSLGNVKTNSHSDFIESETEDFEEEIEQEGNDYDGIDEPLVRVKDNFFTKSAQLLESATRGTFNFIIVSTKGFFNQILG